MFKKTAIALAVAGAYGASLPVQAQETESGFYGFVNASVDYADTENGGVGVMFLPADADGDIHLGDQANSRFGFRGSTDLGNGMTAGARIEIGMGTSAGNRGSVTEDAEPWDKRLAWVDLSGNFGNLRVGNQWGALFEYLGSMTFKSHGFGGGSWYESSRLLNDDGFGLRISDAVDYTYGSGGYGSDPFTFTAQGIFDQDSGGGAGSDETLDAYTLAAASTFGGLTIKGALYGENNGPAEADPSLAGVGGAFAITDALSLGARWVTVDRDTPGADDPDTVSIIGTMDFGGGLSGMASYGTSSDDTDGDLDTFFLQMNKNLGAGTDMYVEFEHGSRDVPAGDPESTVVAVGMKKSF